MAKSTRGLLLLLLPFLKIGSLTPVLAAQEPYRAEGKFCIVEVLRGKVPEDLALLLGNDAVAAADLAGAATEKLLQARFATKPRLVLHGDESSFRAVEKSDTEWAFLVEEFCLADASTAHVLLRPVLQGKIGVQIGLPEPTRQSVLRCAAQLLAMQQSDAVRADPWLAEIVAMGVLEGITNPRGTFGLDPWFDSRRTYHANNTKDGHVFEIRPKLLETGLPLDRDAYDVRCHHVTLVSQFLVKESGAWARRLVSKAPKDTGVVPNRIRVFESVVGKDWTKVQARWAALLKTLQPVWISDGHVRAVGGGFVLAGSREQRAGVFPVAKVMAGDHAIRARVNCCGSEDVEIQFGLDSDDKSLIAVLIREQECSIAEFIVGAGWQKDRVKVKTAVPTTTPIEVEVRVDQQIRLFVDGKELASTPRGNRSMRGQWSVSVHDMVATVENLRIEPLPAPKK
jgi:hypothetical protein